MMIFKSPLRISIGGGGTDLPSYYEIFESSFISAAINKYVYICIHPIFINEIILKYSEMERVKNLEEIRHPIIREAIKLTNIKQSIEISSFADIPAGTGLGSSSAFTVALLKALYTYCDISHTPNSLAEDACRIEIEKLCSPIGKQDQYISSIGGIKRFQIDKSGQVTSRPLEISKNDRIDLESNLLLFFTGYTRSAETLLAEQDAKTKAEIKSNASTSESEILESLHFIKELGLKIGVSLENGEIHKFGELMNEHWQWKKQRSKFISTPQIDQWYNIALQNGAVGGKLVGAGGGGFLLFLADDPRRLRKKLREYGLTDVPFRFDDLGAQVVLHE